MAATALVWSLTAFAAPQTWRFDPVHSQVWFSASHQDFSHPQGRLRIKEGWFRFDEGDWSAGRVDVVIDLTSLDLGDAKWNRAVMSRRFLDTERWPTAHFVSRSVERSDDRHGVIHGVLALHGATRAVDVGFTLNRIGKDPYSFGRKAGFSATAILHRSDFGMDRYKEVVGEDIILRFEIEGLPDREAAPTRDGEP